jgi:predicted nucleotidyltransferase
VSLVTRAEWLLTHRNIVMNKNLAIPKGKIADFCRHNHIRRLSVFGSALRPDFTPDSDVDILVEFEKGREPGFAFFDMQDELSELLGRKVELHTPNFLSRYFRDKVVQEAEVQYAQS